MNKLKNNIMADYTKSEDKLNNEKSRFIRMVGQFSEQTIKQLTNEEILDNKKGLVILAIEDDGKQDLQAIFTVVAGNLTVLQLGQILLSHEDLGQALIALAMDKILRDGLGD